MAQVLNTRYVENEDQIFSIVASGEDSIISMLYYRRYI